MGSEMCIRDRVTTMKIAFDVDVIKDLGITRMVHQVAEWGYKYIEQSPHPQINPFYKHPRASREIMAEYKQALRDTGLELSSFICVYRWSGPDELRRQAAVKNWKRLVEIAVEMDLSHLAMTAQYNPVHSEHITAESTATIRSNAYSFGCTFAEVEVDIPMCKVTLKRIVNIHDCGSLINPALAEAQVHGGMSMGIGYGLSEQLLFDEKTGRPLNNNLLDYKLSTFMDHPDLEAEFVENYEPTSAYGTKALGEPPACSGAPAIRNAIYQATGVAIDQAPITPHILFAKFTEAGLIQD